MKDDQVSAATFFLKRAQEAIAAADDARSLDAGAALYKEAETWLYMASQCLGRKNTPPPMPLEPPRPRVARERRSFRER